MPPQAVQPYLGGSSEQRFSTDLVLYVEAEDEVMVVVAVSWSWSVWNVSAVLWLGFGVHHGRVRGKIRDSRSFCRYGTIPTLLMAKGKGSQSKG